MGLGGSEYREDIHDWEGRHVHGASFVFVLHSCRQELMKCYYGASDYTREASETVSDSRSQSQI